MRKKRIIWILLPAVVLCIRTASFAAYNASMLHNSVKRSGTVKDIFLERLEYIEENEYCFDIFGTFNDVNNVPMLTANVNPDRAGETKTLNMRLKRSYAGLAVFIPTRSLFGFTLGFSCLGYHYGLIMESKINTDGNDSNIIVKDYKHAQFFDDIYAVSFIWKYVYIHAGVIDSKEIMPQSVNSRGKVSFSRLMGGKGVRNRNTNGFFSSNLFSFVNFNFISNKTFDINVSPTKAWVFFIGGLPWFVPELTLDIKRSAIYGDMDFDPVWVKTDKTGLDKRDKVSLTQFTLLVEEKFNKWLYINCYTAFQRASEKLIEKRTGKELELRGIKKIGTAVGCDILKIFFDTGWKFKTEAGLSQYWNEAMPVHSKTGSYKANGLFGSIDVGYSGGLWRIDTLSSGFKLTFLRNDANELEKLIETVNKDIIQIELYFSLKLFGW